MQESYPDKLSAWRSGMEASLRREYSWLSLAGLFWLQEGANPFGSGETNPVSLPERVPAEVGVFTLAGGRLTVTPAAGVELRLNDNTLLETSQALKVDTSGEPDFLFIDDIRLGLIERVGQLAIRVWDPQNPVRLNFGGRIWFEADEKAVVEAKIQAFDPPKKVVVDDIIGLKQKGEMHAVLNFNLRGQELSLEAERLDDGSYYIIFKDATAGASTYPAARYLVSDAAEGDRVTIDFNKAYNPPCAFTAFATCPLPQPENILSVKIAAGEKYGAPD